MASASSHLSIAVHGIRFEHTDAVSPAAVAGSSITLKCAVEGIAASELFSQLAPAEITVTLEEDAGEAGLLQGAVHHSVHTTPFEPSEETLGRIAAATYTIQAWLAQELLGAAHVQLSDVLAGETEAHIEVPLLLHGSNDPTGFLKVVLSCDEATADYCIGSSRLTLRELRIAGLPAAWRLAHGELQGLEGDAWQAKVQDLLAQPANQTFTYTLDWTAAGPAFDNNHNTTATSAADPQQPDAASTGSSAQPQLQLQQPPALPGALARFHTASGALQCRGGSSSSSSGSSGSGSGDWTIAFDAPPGALFLHRSSVHALRAAALAGARLCATVVRARAVPLVDPKAKKPPPPAKGKGAEPAPPPEAPWTLRTYLPLAPLAERPDLLNAELRGALEYGGGDSQSDSESDAARAALLSESGTALRLGARLSRALVTLPPVMAVTPGETVLRVAPPRELRRPKPPVDVEQDWQDEIDAFVRAVLVEYTKLFGAAAAAGGAGGGGGGAEVSAEDRRRQLFYALSAGGMYHRFKEALKPRIQRVVRKRLSTAAAPLSTPTPPPDQLACALYSDLVQRANAVLLLRLRDIEAGLLPQYLSTDATAAVAQRARALGLLAEDAEASEQWERAVLRHQDRIDAIETAIAALPPTPTTPSTDNTPASADLDEARALLTQAWLDMAACCSRRGDLDAAAQALTETLRCAPGGAAHPLNLNYVQFYAAVALEMGRVDSAEAVLEDALATCLPPPSEWGDGYDTDAYAERCPADMCALLSIVRDRQHQPCAARAALRRAVAAALRQSGGGSAQQQQQQQQERPRRTAVALLLGLCEYLLQRGLRRGAAAALAAARAAEGTAAAKAAERGLPPAAGTAQRATLLRLDSALRAAAAANDVAAAAAAVESAQLAAELEPRSAAAWGALAAALRAARYPVEEAEALAAALACCSSAQERGPLAQHARLGALNLALGRPAESKAAWLGGAREWHVPSVWLGAGVAAMELEQWEEAEAALQQANRLDNADPAVWGTLALLLLAQGDARAAEAERALDQALRLGLADAALLRKLGNAFVSVDRLARAEDMLRRALSRETAAGSSGAGAHVRRRLADVLSAQNCVAAAVGEYREVLLSTDAPAAERQEALSRCAPLLKALGREAELREWRAAAAAV
ncbi:hypothetical protein JKP88DRAFT_351274 [Tribonema minus]|uniref:Uncharacterized protein n=1 Tax=Tribonema minus TaxID=303371 RepID=A0A835YIA9_9STRA|nr:hypothetical protein JKP88DRAFT_351274 [Tribonema minus]